MEDIEEICTTKIPLIYEEGYTFGMLNIQNNIKANSIRQENYIVIPSNYKMSM